MNNYQEISLEELTQKLFRTNLKLDKWLEQSQYTLGTIKAKYDPRNEFNRWRNSQEGKEWKKQQYYKQNKCCPICKKPISNLKGSHIDHIKPLATHPHLALDTNNMQITHADCNNLKGKKNIISN